jgi:ABC-type transporter Mla subunit MlaD
MNEPYRLRYTNQIVGAFMILVLLFVIILLVVLLRAGDFLVEQEIYWIQVPQEEVGDLHTGAEVMILGERAGAVEDIRYVDNTDQVRVELSIDPELSDQIFEDSFVRLERKFGLGTPMLVIRRGGPGQQPPVPLASGNRLGNFQGESDRVDQMSQELESVSESIRLIQQQLNPTLTDISSATDRFTGSLDNSVDPAFERIEQASESLYETSEAIRPETLETLQTVRTATENLEQRIETLTEKVETLVENDMRDTLVEVRESTDDVSEAAKSVGQTSADVNKDIANTLVTLRDAAEQVQQLAIETRELVRVVRKEANDLPGTTARVNDTVSDTQDLVGEIRSHWLLRRYSDQGKPSPQVSPSTIRGGSAR